MHVVIHPGHVGPGLARVGALQERALLDAGVDDRRVSWVEVDVLHVGDVGRARKGPARHAVDLTQRWGARPARAEVIADEHLRRLRSRVESRLPELSGRGQAVDVSLVEAVAASLPALTAIAAGVDSAVKSRCEQGAALRLEQGRADMEFLELAPRFAPAPLVALEPHQSVECADQHFVAGRARREHRRATVSQRDRHALFPVHGQPELAAFASIVRRAQRERKWGMTSLAKRSSEGVTSAGSMPTGVPQPMMSVAGSVARYFSSCSISCSGGPTRYD